MMRLDLPANLAQDFADLKTRIDRLERAGKANTPGTANQLPIVAVADLFETVTSGTFAPIYEARLGGPLTHSAFSTFGNIVVDASTTAEWRLRVYTATTVATDLYTAPVVLGAGSHFVGPLSVEMSAYWNLGQSAIVLIQLEARRASGAGNVHVYQPNYVYTASPESFGTPPTPIDDLL